MTKTKRWWNHKGPWGGPGPDGDRSRRGMSTAQDDRNVTGDGTYLVNMRLAREIAKLPPAEREAYWQFRDQRMAFGHDKQRKRAAISLPTIKLPPGDEP